MSSPHRFRVADYEMPDRVEITGSGQPISLQNRNGDKQAMMLALATAVADNTDFIFTGDVKATITWVITQDDRYSTHTVPDLDNIVKPILDAVTGPRGVMVDDNQVQALDVGWQEAGLPGTAIEITISALAGGRLPKAGLFFIEFPGRGCFPVSSERHAKLVVQSLLPRLQLQADFKAQGYLEDVIAGLDPIQRFFPRARLGSFRVRPYSDFVDVSAGSKK